MKLNISKFIRKSGALAGTLVVACGVTYFLTSKGYERQVSDLQEQVNDLKKAELQARVTQRVSEQLEDIAKEQTIISDRERNRAEKQSQIADMERGKAEIEKGLAMKAQQEALASADRAQKAQQVAETQSRLAEENMHIAEQARSHADTLLYISLANSLAQSSLAQAQSGSTPLSRLLSYASWHYSDRYQKDVTNQQNIYKALLQSSGSMNDISTSLQGNIRKIRMNGSKAYGITDYGEVVASDKTSHSLRLGNYDFRDFVFNEGTKATVLCMDGRLLKMDFTDIESASTAKDMKAELKNTLPQESWYHLLNIDKGKVLVATSKNKIAWVDASTCSVLASVDVDYNITAVGMQDNYLHVFCQGGHHYVSEKAGVLANMDLSNLKSDVPVTAYLFDDQRGYHILGMYDGNIYIYDTNGNKVIELIGHSAAVTDLHIWNALLGSCSYDSTLQLWQLTNLTTLISPVVINVNNWPLSFAIDEQNDNVWVGTEKGNILSFCSSPQKNATSTRNSLTREFTDEEWNYYIGNSFEKVKFMK